MVKLYRKAYGLKGFNGILFNHESPRRGETFVTRKITRAISKIYLGTQENLELGNLDAKRDWGFAGDYVKAMWLMLQSDEPDDYVIATGKSISVREFIDRAFGVVGIKLNWVGKGLKEKGVIRAFDKKVISEYECLGKLYDGKELVSVGSRYFRPAEVDYLLGDASKAVVKLRWTPNIDIQELSRMMVMSDLREEYERLFGTIGLKDK
jgi:GDPmannose 4,6-dehydratase